MLTKIGIRPSDKQLTLLLFSNMFFSGLSVGMIRVCAYTLFLAHFGSEQLALIAILLAIAGTFVTLGINWLTRHFSVRGYIFSLLITVLIGLLGFRLSLANSSSSTLIFFLPLWFEIAYMLYSLQFTTLLTRLFDVRQAKRLAGLTRSGEFLAEILGGFSVVLLLTLIKVEDLLIVAFFSTICVFLCVQRTVSAFRSKLHVTTEEVAAAEGKGSNLLTLFRQPYVRLISACYAIYIFAYFTLDVVFYDYSVRQFPNPTELAGFLGQFFAVTGFLTLISLAFVFAPFLRRFGIIAGVMAFPVFITLGSVAVGFLDLGGVPIIIIFVVLVLTNGLRFVLQSSIWRPSIAILFQVMPDRQRYHSNTLIEGIIDPLSGGIAGLILYLLTTYLDWESRSLLFLLSALLLIWILISYLIRRMYLSNLTVTLKKRKLGELTISELDRTSLKIIEQRLNSEHPAEVLYCLDLLENMGHQQYPELVANSLTHSSTAVRMNALQRIERLKLGELSHNVSDLLSSEIDVEVLGQGFVTYGSLRADDVPEKLKPYLKITTPHLHRGALVGLLRFNIGSVEAIQHLLSLVHASDSEQRRFAATVLGEAGEKAFTGLVCELLDDDDMQTVKESIFAASNIHDEKLIAPLVSKLSEPALQQLTARVLQGKGEIALGHLENMLNQENIDSRLKILLIGIISEIGGDQATNILTSLVHSDSPEIKHKVFLGLANLQYQATDDLKYVYANLLEEEVSVISWILASLEDLHQEDGYQSLFNALANELDQRRDNMLLLVSFLFPSVVMLDSRANIDSKVAELRIFALEVLDNVLNSEVKQIVLPILEDITVKERLELLKPKFPQQQLSSSDRFDEIMETYYEKAAYWTQVCLLHQIGEKRIDRYTPVLKKALNSHEAVIRETALWSTNNIQPETAYELLTKMSRDSADNVRSLSRYLMQLTPSPAN
jgi:HEAT repeat protein/ATP/ADP translocase